MAHPQYISQGMPAATNGQPPPSPYTYSQPGQQPAAYPGSAPLPHHPQVGVNPQSQMPPQQQLPTSFNSTTFPTAFPPQHQPTHPGMQPAPPTPGAPGTMQHPYASVPAASIPPHLLANQLASHTGYVPAPQGYHHAPQPPMSAGPMPGQSMGPAPGQPMSAAPQPQPGVPNGAPMAQFMSSPFDTNMTNSIPMHLAPANMMTTNASMPTPSPLPPGAMPGQQMPPLAATPSYMTSGYPPAAYGQGHDTRQGPRNLVSSPEIKLEISAKGLWDRDTVTKSDPTCVVFMEDRRGNQPNFTHGFDAVDIDNDDVTPGGVNGGNNRPSIRWKEIGRTECLKNNLNPHFKVQVTVPFVFEQLQHIRFGLWDIDSKQASLDSHDFLGDARTTVGELVMSGVWKASLSSPNAKDRKTWTGSKRDLGKIEVIVHEDRDGGNVLIKAHLAGRRLDRKDFGISSDPYFIATQVGGRYANSRSQLYESEVIRRTINPTWKPFHIKVAKPKGGNNSDMKIEFLVYDKDKHSRDDEIGKATLSVDELENTTEVVLINDRKRMNILRRNKNSGNLRFSNVRVIPMPSLVDYLQGGLKLHFSVAIDLTASNGNPNEPLSLHYCHDFRQGNQYTRALTAIANVLRVYAPPDQLFAAFGFGAVLPGAPGYTNSCFPLSLRPDPMCQGLQGILEAYVTALRTVKLSGPTNFAPLIDTVSRTAAQRVNTQTDQNYDILLVLTDGVVSDYELTVDQIISASHKAPLSIIIIGIGNRNFDKMRELDSDGKLLTSSDLNRQAARDICQFVAFSDHEGQSPERLGAAVLAEVPGNIVEYFAGICNPPINPGRRPDHLSSFNPVP